MENIDNIIGDGIIYVNTPTIPLKPYLANIELTEKPRVNDLKNIIINIIGKPITDKPKSHIETVYNKFDNNSFLNISILSSKLSLLFDKK